MFRRGESLLKNAEQLRRVAVPERIRIEPQPWKTMRAEDAVRARRQGLVPIPGQFLPQELFLTGHGDEIFLDTHSLVHFQLNAQISCAAGGGDLNDKLRGPGCVIAFVRGLTATGGQDPEAKVRLRHLACAHQPGAFQAGLAPWCGALIVPEPLGQDEMKSRNQAR